MLTRLRVKGFKSLRDVEVAFGPFTCIAGLNAAGKSNLFDVIMLLSDLASMPIIEAASRVRDRQAAQRGDAIALFTKSASGSTRSMSLEVEFLVSKVVQDDFGRSASPSATHLRYRVELEHLPPVGAGGERVQLLHESLTYVPKRESRRRLGFQMTSEFWSSVIGAPRRSDFISTEVRDGEAVVRLKQEGVQGRPQDVPARRSPRTVLSTINTEDKPTALAARREMQSWALLQLEPSKLRMPDDFDAPASIGSDGSNMAATLHHLDSYDQVANRLARLLPEVRSLSVDVDNGRRLKTLTLKQADGFEHTARALSDGTLRFLALAILAQDPRHTGLVCLEEPENGIHPSRIPAVLDLIEEISVDPSLAVDSSNPLRQVIISTHSPAVIQHLEANHLVMAFSYKLGGASLTSFGVVPGTWRSTLEYACEYVPTVRVGALIDYLTTDTPSDDKAATVLTVKEFAKTQGVFPFMRETEK